MVVEVGGGVRYVSAEVVPVHGDSGYGNQVQVIGGLPDICSSCKVQDMN